MVTCNSKSHFNGTVLKQKKTSQSIIIFRLVFYLLVKNINGQRKVTNSFQDMVKILHGKKLPFFSCLFRVCENSSV